MTWCLSMLLYLSDNRKFHELDRRYTLRTIFYIRGQQELCIIMCFCFCWTDGLELRPINVITVSNKLENPSEYFRRRVFVQWKLINLDNFVSNPRYSLTFRSPQQTYLIIFHYINSLLAYEANLLTEYFLCYKTDLMAANSLHTSIFNRKLEIFKVFHYFYSWLKYVNSLWHYLPLG